MQGVGIETLFDLYGFADVAENQSVGFFVMAVKNGGWTACDVRMAG